MKLIATIVLSFFFCRIAAQTLGGSTVYSFLDLPNTPQLTALGGINLSAITDDAGLSFNDPALLRSSMHAQLSTSFNAFYDGIHIYNLWMPLHAQRLQTNFAAGVNFFDYGNIPRTDASGNILGDFHPSDYVVQLAASRQYEKKWFYGVTLKFIHSSYGVYSSSGVAMDIGINYYDSVHLFQAGLTARNMGVQYSPYEGTQAGELPFDLSIGITKRLARAPLQFSFTAHHLQQFDISHFILAAQAFPGDKVEITMAYNYLRRKELDLGEGGNGFTGWSFGLGVLMKKWQLRYARSYYQNTKGYNQMGLDIRLND